MKFTIVKEPIPFLIIDNTYESDELKLIYNELESLFPYLRGPDETISAVCKGKLKKNLGLFLESFYREKSDKSKILQLNRKLYLPEVLDALSSCHYAYNLYRLTNSDTTLVSYYDEGGSYFAHNDLSVTTAVTWFFKEPKNFTGGGFKFTDYNIDIEVKNNRTVIFFGSYEHEISELKTIHKNIPLSGRFALSQFSNIR